MRAWKPATFLSIGIAMLMLAPASTSATSMSGEERGEALWYANDWFQVDGLQAAGATGKGITIAVIDGVLNPDVAELKGANVTVKGAACVDGRTGKPFPVTSDDPSIAHHATNVVSMIVGNGVAADGGAGTRGIAPDADVWFYGVGELTPESEEHCVPQDPSKKPGDIDLAHDLRLELAGTVAPQVLAGPEAEGDIDSSALAARAAIRDGADIVSISVVSGSRLDWDQVLVEAELAGIPIVTSTRNPNAEFELGTESGGPWATNGAVPVSAVNSNGDTLTSQATGSVGEGSRMLAFAAPGEDLLGVATAEAWGSASIAGTSMATPLVAGSIAVGMQAHPKASAFQVLQAFVHTTGSGEMHEPQRLGDLFGYGYANPLAVVNSDPTEFKDENPMFVTSIEDERCTGRDGVPGQLIDDVSFYCHWSTGPFLPAVEAYEAVITGEELATDGFGNPVDSPYSSAVKGGAPGEQAGPGTDALKRALTVSLVGGAVILVAAAIVVPILVIRSRKQTNGPAQPPFDH